MKPGFRMLWICVIIYGPSYSMVESLEKLSSQLNALAETVQHTQPPQRQWLEEFAAPFRSKATTTKPGKESATQTYAGNGPVTIIHNVWNLEEQAEAQQQNVLAWKKSKRLQKIADTWEADSVSDAMNRISFGFDDLIKWLHENLPPKDFDVVFNKTRGIPSLEDCSLELGQDIFKQDLRITFKDLI